MGKEFLDLDLFKSEEEKTMEKSLIGKWRYCYSTENFSKILTGDQNEEKNFNMPKYLFFAQGGSGTDGDNIASVYNDNISIKNEKYKYIFLQKANLMVLYDEPIVVENKKLQQAFVFYVYKKQNSYCYTNEEIKEIQDDQKLKRVDFDISISIPDKKFNGVWDLYGLIKEDKIENLKKEEINSSFNFMSPMFDSLHIQDKNVDVMSDGDSLTIDHKVTYNKENSKMFIFSCDAGVFILNNILNIKQKVYYKEIDGEEYLFTDFTNSIDSKSKLLIDVYKKRKD